MSEAAHMRNPDSTAKDAEKRPKTRFAPSPTGYLHLGHVASAIYVWGLKSKLNADVFVRIEDHDQSRCKPEFVEAIFTDLDWLGFKADILAVQQSDHWERYERALKSIEHLVYGCTCSRSQIQSSSDQDPQRELRYPGICRLRRHKERATGDFAASMGLRCKLSDVVECFHDYILGDQSQNPFDQCGDLLIKDRHRQWTYQFAVVVDDLEEGVDWVIRGQDLTASTGRQIQLRRLLRPDANPLMFAHHPLIIGSDGQKLSKRQFSQSIADRRRSGQSREEVLGEASFGLGLIPRLRPVEPEEIASFFCGN